MRCCHCKTIFERRYLGHKYCEQTKDCKEAFVEFKKQEREKKYLKERSKKKKPLKRTKIRQKSEKRQKQEDEYWVVRDEYLAKNKKCERCGKKAKYVHHKNGREGERLTDVRFFMAVCTKKCHRYIHLNPEESREKGWLI